MGDNRTPDKTSSQIVKEIKNKRYSVILLLMSIVTFFGLNKVKDQFSLKVFAVYMLIGSIAGWSWQLFVTYLDPAYSGWWYDPHKIWGSVGLVAYEDVVFYPICGALFYLVRLIMPSVNTSQRLSQVLKVVTISIFSILGIASLFIFNIGGRSSTYWFLIPGICLYLYTFKEINITKFLFTGLFIIAMASAWDLWIKDWLYITADLHQSKIWLDYKIHPWAWINNSPVEITPWFSICGWVFIYPLAEVCEIQSAHQDKV